MKKFFIVFFSYFISTQFTYATTRIMPLGDSITYDEAHIDLEESTRRPIGQRHGYRNHLWYKLRDANFSVDFVGSRVSGQDISPHFDPENEGYPGETSEYIANNVYSFLQNNSADIILLHIGSNDWSSNISHVEDLLDEIDRYESNYEHHIKVILAKIINRTSYESIRHEFNTNLQNLANSRINNGDDIYVVDMEYGAGLYYDDRNFRDKTHPNDLGYQKMANVWFNALAQFLNIPSKPTKTKAIKITPYSITLQWNDNSTNEQGFKIWQGNTRVATLGENITSTTIFDLLPRTTYTLEIRSYNNNGNSDFEKITFTTKDNYAWLPAIYNIILY